LCVVCLHALRLARRAGHRGGRGSNRPASRRDPTKTACLQEIPEIVTLVGRNLATRVPTGFCSASTANLRICRENARRNPLKCLRAAELRYPRVRESGMRSAGRTTVILRCAIPVAGPTPTTHGSSSSWSPLFVARIVPFSDYHDKRATRVEESAERPMSDAPAETVRLRLEPPAQRAVAHGRLGSPGAASVARVGNGQEVVHLRPVAHRLVTGAESGTGPSLAVSHRAGGYEE